MAECLVDENDVVEQEKESSHSASRADARKKPRYRATSPPESKRRAGAKSLFLGGRLSDELKVSCRAKKGVAFGPSRASLDCLPGET